MLNHKLYLNKEIFSDKVEKKTTRAGFGSGLAKAGDPSADGNKNVVALTADLRDSVNSTEFAKKFPERFFECGVAEQNMITVASGLAISGKIPFTTSYAYRGVRTGDFRKNSVHDFICGFFARPELGTDKNHDCLQQCTGQDCRRSYRAFDEL
ncbi:MAG: Transketolase, central region [Parcubacteria group bacterium GW2011_GWB1_45_7]|nr:MAG: Transketolase, central region [Parcubacteria group bacterium GW2011_GWB1_45_7]